MIRRSMIAAIIAAVLCLLALPAMAENCAPQTAGQLPATGPQSEIFCNQGSQIVPDGWTFSGSATSTGAIPYLSPGPTNGIIDTTGYQTISFQATSIGAGNTIHFETSNDGATWVNHAGCFNGGQANPLLNVTAAVFVCQAYTRYMRINVTVYGSGTISVLVVAKQGPTASGAGNVAQGLGGSTAWSVKISPQTTGGATNFRINAAATTNATNVKASAGQVYGWCLTNAAAALRYVRLFNLATAPTVGTSTPTQTIILAANGGEVCQSFDFGIVYATGIAFDITGANGDSDATAVTANDVSGALYFQ